jgi:hypothetical protein
MTCAIADCGETMLARGWCRKHYYRWRRNGTTDLLKGQSVCSVEDCGRGARGGRGWCRMHYARWRKHGDPTVVIEPRRNVCSVSDCDSFAHGRGFCLMHWKRWRKSGSTDKRPRDWRRPGPVEGTRYVDRQGGYVRVYLPSHLNADKNGVVKEHIAVMADHLGRRIATDRGETIHHKNGVRGDNRIENLELRVGAHPQGLTVDDAVAWAREILERYE